MTQPLTLPILGAMTQLPSTLVYPPCVSGMTGARLVMLLLTTTPRGVQYSAQATSVRVRQLVSRLTVLGLLVTLLVSPLL